MTRKEDGDDGDAWSFAEYQGNNIVSGFLADEVELEDMCDCSFFSNAEIYDHLESYFHFFGSRDMDIIYLYFLSQKRQDDIMRILDKTQPAISYDVNRIREQMDFVVRISSFTDEFILFVSDDSINLTTEERERLIVFFFSTSFIKTSRILNKNSITCRSHILETIDKLRELGYLEQHDFLIFMLNNLNRVKKEVE